MIPVYRPDKFNIGIGIPGTPFYVEITDWVSITVDKPAQRFTITKGILGEPFLEMSTDSSRTFSLSILQKSKNIEDLQNIVLAQLTGFAGFPFSIIDNSTDSNVDQGRQKSFYPVSVILDERQESFAIEGTTWIYRIGTPSGTTIFF